MPITPISVRASLTSSSLKGLMMASTFFISDLLENRDRECRHVRADALQVRQRSEEHTSELQSRLHLVCRLLLEKKKKVNTTPAPSYLDERRSTTTITSDR